MSLLRCYRNCERQYVGSSNLPFTCTCLQGNEDVNDSKDPATSGFGNGFFFPLPCISFPCFVVRSSYFVVNCWNVLLDAVGKCCMGTSWLWYRLHWFTRMHQRASSNFYSFLFLLSYCRLCMGSVWSGETPLVLSHLLATRHRALQQLLRAVFSLCMSNSIFKYN